MRALIRSLGRERTVILSTHILPEVEAVCDRALIIHQGALVADGTVEQIRAGRRASILATVRAAAEEARAAFAGMPGIETVEVTPTTDGSGRVEVRLVGTADRDVCEQVAARASERRLPLSGLRPEIASLEQIFADLTASAPAAAPAPATEEVARA